MVKKKIAIIGTVGVPASYGGFETLVENLLDYLEQDFQVTVFCQSSAYSEKLQKYKNANLQYINFSANGPSSILYDVVSVLKSFRSNDLLLILGVSGTIILPFIKPLYNGRIIVNIDGLEWKRDKWNWLAKKFLKFSEKIAVNFSDVVVADNLHIQNYVKVAYGKESTLIAYGGDHVKKSAVFSIGEKYNIKKEQYFFTVCRIEPENNLDLIVQAYEQANLHFPYVIIGNFQSSNYGKEFREKYAHISGLMLIDSIYNQEILDQFRSNCFYYLHGHSAGGTNPSLVEAMYLSLPIIAFGVNYNRATTANTALYFDSKSELLEIFANIKNIDRERLKKETFEQAHANYSWEIICASYVQVFSDL